MTIDFTDISYLQHGNARQQSAYKTLVKYNIMGVLSAYTPLLIGTIPIAIDIDTSDLDIACYWHDKAAFVNTLQTEFGTCDNFRRYENINNDIYSIVAAFNVDGFDVEVFGQHIPVQQQFGYRHLMIEHKIIQERGEDFRQQVIALKQQGYKTEPAFAKLLGLEGDPYEALLLYK